MFDHHRFGRDFSHVYSDCSIRVFRSVYRPGRFGEKLLTFLRQGIVKTPFKCIWIVYICVLLGAVASYMLLLSEKSKCNVAIREKIKVRPSYMYLFTIER